MTRGPTRLWSLRRFSRFAAAALVMLACLLAGAVPARAADDGSAADARRHAKRASHLSELGKCKQAVAEYDKALAVLRDPALLFNRAECHRLLGDTQAALDDYTRFLIDLPHAPNRAEVEARIAELRKAPTQQPAGAPSVAAPSPLAGAKVPAGAKAPAEVARTSAAVTATAAPAPRVAPPPPAPANAGAPGGTRRNVDLLLSEPEPAPKPIASDDSLTNRPWFWIAISAVAIGVGVGAYLALRGENTSVPPSPLGNYKF